MKVKRNRFITPSKGVFNFGIDNDDDSIFTGSKDCPWVCHNVKCQNCTFQCRCTQPDKR